MQWQKKLLDLTKYLRKICFAVMGKARGCFTNMVLIDLFTKRLSLPLPLLPSWHCPTQTVRMNATSKKNVTDIWIFKFNAVIPIVVPIKFVKPSATRF